MFNLVVSCLRINLNHSEASKYVLSEGGKGNKLIEA
jgi:hypothetical protein